MDYTPVRGTVRVPHSAPEVKDLLHVIEGKSGVFTPAFVMDANFGDYAGELAFSLPPELWIKGDGWLTTITWIPARFVQLDADQTMQARDFSCTWREALERGLVI
ncbi:hypothetical protein [Paracoccus sp. SSJ]|uniref:hypothetical protein n=1 Tax=Paracoccus sp. SSJ TaxID=3050636 RepID=UPI00254A16B4|nr:hypothetical protein [Paracoccus sp. SSJ]MDK8874677.1 hypothetical protein [Paracoccus sp. SSJ]